MPAPTTSALRSTAPSGRGRRLRGAGHYVAEGVDHVDVGVLALFPRERRHVGNVEHEVLEPGVLGEALTRLLRRSADAERLDELVRRLGESAGTLGHEHLAQLHLLVLEAV